MNCRPEDMLLYAVTDRAWLNGETLESQVEKALKGGATFVQLREKELDEEMFLEEAKKIKKLCAEYHVPFVINDNVDIALKVDADGVHVGWDRIRSSVFPVRMWSRHFSRKSTGQITSVSERCIRQEQKRTPQR